VIGSSSACFVYLPLLDTAIEMPDGMISQGTVMLLDQLPAHEFDRQQWPPPLLDCNTLLIGTSQGDLSFCSPVGFCPATAQRKPPWPPPPVQSEVTDDKVQLRPIPWPSFWGYSIDMHWLKFLKYAQPTVRFIWVQYISENDACMISNGTYVVWLIRSCQHVILVGLRCSQMQETSVTVPFFHCVSSDANWPVLHVYEQFGHNQIQLGDTYEWYFCLYKLLSDLITVDMFDQKDVLSRVWCQYLFIWSPWNCQCSTSVSLQCVMHIVSAQLRPIPWPSFGSHTVMELEIILRLSSTHWQIPTCSEMPNGWQINGCSSNGTCGYQVFTFSWISGLHLYQKLMVSQHTLQAILVTCALGFWFRLTSFTTEIQSDVSDSNFHMNQFACSFRKAITIDNAGNYMLDLSKCAILCRPKCCACRAVSSSDHMCCYSPCL
jgi:hypothetical protein